MNILIAIDKFKGSMSALQAAKAIQQGLINTNPDITIQLLPMADGGDGTLAVLKHHLPLDTIHLETLDPIGRKIDSHYLSDGQTAYIELAISSGLALLKNDELAPMKSNSIGTGLLIQDAIKQNHASIVLALGGSSSTDGGTGILHTLGYKFLDKHKTEIIPCGGNLSSINEIIPPSQPITTPFLILTDVKNKLHGLNGAAFQYAPQKGASPAQVIQLDNGLQHLENIFYQFTGNKIGNLIGGGAAGGIAATLSATLNTTIHNGFQYLAAKAHLSDAISKADLIITGEGTFDESSFNGKLVGEIIHIAGHQNKSILVVCGKKNPDLNFSAFAQIINCHEILQIEPDLDTAMKNAASLLCRIGEEIDLGFRG